MREHIREQLKEYAEESYRDFSAALAPGDRPLLGVRLPQLRKIAKEIAKGDWKQEIHAPDKDIWFEETMLRGMIIGYGTEKAEVSEGLRYLERMIPYVDGWSICDSFCTSFGFAAKHREEVWEFLQPYLYSEKEFEVRVGVILLLTHFLKCDRSGKKAPRKRVITMEDVKNDTWEKNREEFPYMERILNILNRPYDQGYYAQMAAAWTTAEAFVTFPYETTKMLTAECRMDDWTRRKAIQKIRESRNPDAEVKTWISKH